MVEGRVLLLISFPKKTGVSQAFKFWGIYVGLFAATFGVAFGTGSVTVACAQTAALTSPVYFAVAFVYLRYLFCTCNESCAKALLAKKMAIER